MKCILTDIEGTTTSLALVKDVLFPYARQRLPEFVRTHRNQPSVRAALDAVRAQSPEASLSDDAVVSVLLEWMAEDRKATPLKALQGMIWNLGYRSGELQGHVYDDAVAKLREWRSHGIALYVYSSGSVEAQKLLFEHTSFGDLTFLFSGYFDTTIGPKHEARSYGAIASNIGLSPEHILFLSDRVSELDAARDAGLKTLLIDRDATSHADGSHPRAQTFDEIDVHAFAGRLVPRAT